jgi:hypothetical protein
MLIDKLMMFLIKVTCKIDSKILLEASPFRIQLPTVFWLAKASVLIPALNQVPVPLVVLLAVALTAEDALLGNVTFYATITVLGALTTRVPVAGCDGMVLLVVLLVVVVFCPGGGT